MKTTASIKETRAWTAAARAGGCSVGLVPTMGALHAGHRSLVQAAVARCDSVAVSIFVNPTQFGPNEDFDSYPRPLEEDLKRCRQWGVGLVFTPAVETMYPADAGTTVHVAGLTEGLCGAHRPGHFDGVATVVTKLLNIVTPDVAFFGEKDYQQLKVIERLVRDLDMPVEIVPCPIVRDDDGLAVSSRNAYLTAAQREQALSLSAAMREAAGLVERGERDVSRLVEQVRCRILQSGDVCIDYVSIVDAETLAPLDTLRAPARICLAVRIGACRLIDNLALPACDTGG